MQQNGPFCVLLKNNFLGVGVANPRPPTDFSLSRVGRYASIPLSAPNGFQFCTVVWYHKIQIKFEFQCDRIIGSKVVTV